ncbi:conserved protein of unknown function [uncultured Sphingopyxis sp.]|uniref:DUF983 domain-containing protein n=1 Tax=uncultured Sphingopyxis sp. TaxID=310581 RepID=A0A1Y5PTT6_9SPHN|nr:DUF983 domain-containing protein [uncultured Sphingopyxis sp.]SBV33408.1 conserved protein of unknown function [uncultured Sphingopyxis sp.]
MDNQPQKGQPPIARAALFGLCPQCGAQTLFEGPVKFAPRCRVCGLDFGSYNVGDGPAAFLTLIIGALLVVIALTLDAMVRPPIWVHVLLWVPLTAVAVVYGLRVGKGALLASEHQRQAAEGRRVDKGDD